MYELFNHRDESMKSFNYSGKCMKLFTHRAESMKLLNYRGECMKLFN